MAGDRKRPKVTAARKSERSGGKEQAGPCAVALLLIDVINDMEFPGGDRLVRAAVPAAKEIAGLVRRARTARVPIIFANDNFGHWRSEFRTQLRHCLEDAVRGQPVAALLQPTFDDYFVLKPKHSAFFSTALEVLLHTLETRTLVMAGFAGDNCVLFTAHDAYMRDYHLVVPLDAVASEDATSNRWALAHMERFLKCDTRPARTVDFDRLKDRQHARGATARDRLVHPGV
ncbi:MAG: cysteine hydrolase [Myxococcales bacterium]|nr:cysteine hydrolase [Myxococcales bacterium]